MALRRQVRPWAVRAGGVGGAGLVLDQISVPAFCAFSFGRKLRTAYSGPAFMARQLVAGTSADIGFTSANLVDHAAGLALAGSTDTRVYRVYDQSGNGRHLASTVDAAHEPRLYNGGVADAMANGVKGARFEGFGDYLQADEGGGFISLTGSPGLTIAIAFQRTSGDNRLFEFGSGATNFASIIVDHENARPAFVGMRGGGSRVFTTTTTTGVPKWWIIKIGAGAAVSTWQIEEDGVDLPQASVSSGSNVLNFTGAANQNITLGNWVGENDGFVGYVAAFLVWTSLLGSSDLALLRAEMDNYA